MANPTTNFGWQMPTSTDLVTDLPADFEVFGQAVDTSLADLKGGTTGQVLKKNSNTDMDFVWSADSAGMTNPMTTTGDTIYSSSGSTPARLGIGSSGQVLTVSGGVPSWATPSSGSMTLLTSTTISSGTSTLTYDSLSQTYKSIVVIFDTVVYSAAGPYLTVKFNNTANIYGSNLSDSGGTGMGITGIGYLVSGAPMYSTSLCNTTITIPNYATSGILKGAYTNSIHKETSVGYDMIQGKTIANLTDAITRLDFAPNSGTFTSGNVYVYGVK